MLGTKRFFAFAVEASPERHLAFPEHVVMADHVNEFDLLFDLHYYASDPAAVAGNRNKDPLGRVRRKAAEIVRREVSRLDWGEVWGGFQGAGERIVAVCIPELRTFAAPYGIAINALYLTERMSEFATRPIRHDLENKQAAAIAESDARRDVSITGSREAVTIAQSDSAHRVEQNELANILQGAALKRAAHAATGTTLLQDEFVSAMAGAIQRVAGQLTTPEQFEELLVMKQTVLRALGNGSGDAPAIPEGAASGLFGNGAHAALPGGGMATAALPATTSAGRLGGLLAEVAAATQKVKNRNQRLALSSALLHLVADVLVDETGSAAAGSEHADRATSLIDVLAPAPSSQEADALRRLADPEHLHELLDY
ncbi:MAG: hypothetical protein JO306_03510 [Gemmatimonadetes bacterium]|nr:hypothetical protein [Gemmatimonadota bacterium]